MSNAVPQRLYKYVSPERFDVLQNGMMRFSPPMAFNDPFELSTTLSSFHAPGTDPLESILDSVEIGRWMLRMTRQAMSGGINQYFAGLIGVLSLAERPDNLLMWAHYASNHQGFVIELDSQHAFFDRRENEHDRLHHIRPVSYPPRRPSVAMKDYNAVDALLVKGADWAYEQEWRMMVRLSEADRTIEHNGGAIHLFRYPAACITGIILGCRMSSQQRDPLLDLLGTDDRYRQVPVRQAILDNDEFKLTFVESATRHAKSAEIAMIAKDFAAALLHAERALEVAQPREKGRYYGLRGVIYGNLGKPEEAHRDLAEFKRLDPNRFESILKDAQERTQQP
jgi:hypothetical protein